MLSDLDRAKEQGLLSEIGILSEELRQSGIRLSDTVLVEVLRLAGESKDVALGIIVQSILIGFWLANFGWEKFGVESQWY